ncbi:formylglycine-generating enzyme family protein [Streptomyces tailanensis]|uniref:formylglycine-generating enzyme family protein n=1 Tax=Streptomyces tailanensis TaxID=2569858 RepID=UPI00122DC876|nr:SUMF1/EgtB/PvdO family nonheme iron enzyme [Streptomyces tailanensis]
MDADMTTETGMISVHPGSVTLSDRRTRRRWVADVTPFRLAVHPVTHGVYERVRGGAPTERALTDRIPAVNVSWWDAVRFCNALSEEEGLTPAYSLPEWDSVEWSPSADGYRLPTEAEWEYACRAGTTGPRYGPLDDIAWHRANSGERLHEVAGRRPNPWGLHDMLGNVWEWCWDLYDPEVYGTYRVLRGGGWFDEHWSCRAGVRRRSHPTFRVDDVGFRVARSGAGAG